LVHFLLVDQTILVLSTGTGKVPVIGTFTGTGTFTNFGISVVPVPDGENSSPKTL
jgi:hypothetical protein